MTTLAHGSRLPALPAVREPSSASWLSRLAAAFWLLVDSFVEAKQIARDAHEKLPFAEW
jgi:hypothetical protein